MRITPIPDDAELVEDTPRMLQILDRIHGSGLELYARAPGDDEVWRTTISRIDTDAGRIVYHQLTPATWQQADLSQPLELHCLVPGCRVAYSVVLTAAGDGSVIYFESDLPDLLLYHQLRKQYRICLAARESGISLSAEKTAWTGELINLSEGGCRARLRADSSAFSRGQLIDSCRIWVEDLFDVQCDVEVCHSQVVGKQLEISLAFRSLTPQHAQRLRKSLAALQRANLRMGVANIA